MNERRPSCNEEPLALPRLREGRCDPKPPEGISFKKAISEVLRDNNLCNMTYRPIYDGFDQRQEDDYLFIGPEEAELDFEDF